VKLALSGHTGERRAMFLSISEKRKFFEIFLDIYVTNVTIVIVTVVTPRRLI
jgi:hypothetical protein